MIIYLIKYTYIIINIMLGDWGLGPIPNPPLIFFIGIQNLLTIFN